MDRTDILNLLAKTFGYKSYLEIGIFNPDSNFNKIDIPYKVSVEPFPNYDVSFIGTSDEFFSILDPYTKYDLIFIDGLHTSHQVAKDIDNSLKHIKDDGTVVCHDCLPTSEQMQSEEPRFDTWTGGVWKVIADLRTQRDDLDIKVIDTDFGVGIIRNGKSNLYDCGSDNYRTYEYYSNNRNELLNVITPEEFLDFLNQNR